MCSAKVYCGEGITYDYRNCTLKLQIHIGITVIRQAGWGPVIVVMDADLCFCTVPANPDSLLEPSEVKLKTVELLRQFSSINQSLHSYCTTSAVLVLLQYIVHIFKVFCPCQISYIVYREHPNLFYYWVWMSYYLYWQKYPFKCEIIYKYINPFLVQLKSYCLG
jgi:hypothetical protein